MSFENRKTSTLLVYKISSSDVEVFVDDVRIQSISKDYIARQNEYLFADLISGEHKRTFSLLSGQRLADSLCRESLSASSLSTTSDIDLKLVDDTGREVSGLASFSIKSKLGNAPTLLNATGATNFNFRISPTLPSEHLDVLNRLGPQGIVSELVARGHRFIFAGMQSTQFMSNLELIDSQMPEVISKIVLAYYSTSFSSFVDLAEFAIDSPVSVKTQQIFKLKQFLGAISMGLRPNSIWDGDPTKFQGNIVLNRDGVAVGYYRRNLAEFQNYLFNETRLETASTSRHQFGNVETRNGESFIKLNLQIRFV